jgi:MFS superfamily sulfate permease-like transporter
MSDSKLPQVRPSNAVQASQKNELTSATKALSISAGATVIGAIAVFAFTQSVVAAIVLGVFAAVLFLARQLVKKSAMATSPSTTAPNASLDSTTQRLQEMRKQVSKCKFLENVEAEGTKAAEQAQQLLQQFQNLQAVLSQKFDPTELTYSRYKVSVDDTCLAIAENLLHLKNLLESLNIQNLKQTAPVAWQQQISEVHQALTTNSAALSELTSLHTSLNQISTQETHRDQLEQSLQQIRDLADRAKQYSKH